MQGASDLENHCFDAHQYWWQPKYCNLPIPCSSTFLDVDPCDIRTEISLYRTDRPLDMFRQKNHVKTRGIRALSGTDDSCQTC